MTVLDQLVDELRAARGPIRSGDLANRIGVSGDSLVMMVDVLVSKGVLSGSATPSPDETIACSGVACGATCVGLDECLFIVTVPETYTLVIDRAVPLSERQQQ
jgi:hypothetical protein